MQPPAHPAACQPCGAPVMTAPQPGRPAPIPLNVVTGFLGAGKTTLLNRLLRDPWMADTVVVINEFGEIGLDHLLVEKVDEDLVLMAAGCLCCTVRGDLIATLETCCASATTAASPRSAAS